MSPKKRLLASVLFAAQAVCAQDVRIGVLGLFRPHAVTLKAAPGQALIIQTKTIQTNLAQADKSFVLERSSGSDTAEITVSRGELILRTGKQSLRISELHASSRGNGAADFLLAITGKISRRYHGVLELKAAAGTLVPVVQMDLETAVASVVQAESAPDTPLEALRAQAVATRSYFVASRGRHHDFDFCDTTHCQFLREPPPPESNASRAAAATRGLVLTYQDHAVAAMFTRSCGGRTRTPQELGLSSDGYPYFSAVCEYCLRHPAHWVRHLAQADAAQMDLREPGEASRLNIGRRLGWNAVPSNNFTARSDAKGVVLEGTGQGHGIGLCQAGGKAMAQSGAGFREILAHYYPNTVLVNLPFGWSSASIEGRVWARLGPLRYLIGSSPQHDCSDLQASRFVPPSDSQVFIDDCHDVFLFQAATRVSFGWSSALALHKGRVRVRLQPLRYITTCRAKPPLSAGLASRR